MNLFRNIFSSTAGMATQIAYALVIMTIAYAIALVFGGII